MTSASLTFGISHTTSVRQIIDQGRWRARDRGLILKVPYSVTLHNNAVTGKWSATVDVVAITVAADSEGAA